MESENGHQYSFSSLRLSVCPSVRAKQALILNKGETRYIAFYLLLFSNGFLFFTYLFMLFLILSEVYFMLFGSYR